jgi:hypothetical protein
VRPAEAWLRERVGNAPTALLEEMIAALPCDGTADIPEALAEASRTLYARVLAGGAGREGALPLLAADALATHAFEAQAALEPGGIAPLAERMLARLPIAHPSGSEPCS